MPKSKSRLTHAQKQQRAQHRQKVAAVRDNQGWDSLFQTYSKCIDQLQAPGAMSAVVKQDGFAACIPNKATWDELVGILDRDTRSLLEKLQLIYNQHKDKRGDCHSPDEFATLLHLYEAYMAWLQVYETSVAPVLNQALEILGLAEVEWKRRRSTPAHQDPSNPAPIDVEVKETNASEIKPYGMPDKH